jgi:hypothetical protein
MVEIEKYEVKEAGRIYGDMAEKVAMNIDIQAAPTIGAIVGGMVTARTQHKQYLKNKDQNERLEKDFYSQANNVLKNLKIVFTPINVIYSVNNQVFEIIGVNEMNALMQKAFLEKDAPFFKNILVNKMNMELQLAQQAFVQRMMQNQQQKQANFLDQQFFLKEASGEEVDAMLMKAATLTDVKIEVPLNLDSLRPFEDSEFFFDSNVFKKVAGVFSFFKSPETTPELTVGSVGINDIKNQVDVGFLPDRVVFLYDGNMFEQLTLLSMNDKGYEAFVKRDKEFFKNFLEDASRKIQHAVIQNVQTNSTMLEKRSASIEEVVDRIITPEIVDLKTEVNVFKESDLHPMIYVKVLSDKYGNDWHDLELESILKQIEIDFQIEDKFNDIALNKIAALQSVMDDENSMFRSSFTFEKFGRTMNNKDVDFVRFEGNLSLSEVMFALEMAKLLRGETVFDIFNDMIPQYVAEELFDNNIRVISATIFDEGIGELDFFEEVNGYLMRKFKERDALGATNPQKISMYYQTAEIIALVTDQILEQYADEIIPTNIADSVDTIITKYRYMDFVADEYELGVRKAIIENVLAHYEAAIFLEYKKEELKALLSLLSL